MKALVLQNGQLHVREIETPVLGPDDVSVQLKVAGLNRRDLYIPSRVGNEDTPLILGSDGAGIVDAVGENVTKWKPGDEVIINPALRWDKNSDAPPVGFDILGMPDHGTIAEKIVIDKKQLQHKPAYLSWEEAGVLALAALTGYRALVTKGQVKEGETVFIPGAGSGVATYIIQFAKALGAKVIVTSRSARKRDAALEIGADIAIDTNDDWVGALQNESIDLVIDSVGRATFNRSLDVLRHGGRMVVFGATTEDIVNIDIRKFFYAQQQIIGSTMGSREELEELLTLMEEKKIRPVVGHTYELDHVKEAMELLEMNDQFGKIAITIS